MTNNTCNGWRNAATWTVNLWFGDSWANMVEDGMDITPELCREDVERYIEEICGAPEAGNGFLWDMLDLNAVDWAELAAPHEMIVEG